MGRFSRAPATVDSASSSSHGTDSTPIPPMMTNNNNNKSKITSGISTLFRRQSPDPDAWTSGEDHRSSGSGASGYARSRGDPSGQHATRDGPQGRIRPTSASAAMAASTTTINSNNTRDSSPITNPMSNPMSNNPIIGTMKGRLVASGSSLLAAAVLLASFMFFLRTNRFRLCDTQMMEFASSLAPSQIQGIQLMRGCIILQTIS